jgi:hypothetical protein
VLGPGKRLRPAFVYWGYRAAGGEPGSPGAERAIGVGCAVELLHACALTCDDVMDGSRTRRGRPAAHVRFAGLHRRERWSGDPEGFGRAVATLLGLLLSGWAEQAVVEAGIPPERLPEVLALLGLLRTEAIGGQYLDVVQARRGIQVARRRSRPPRAAAAAAPPEQPRPPRCTPSPVSLRATLERHRDQCEEAEQQRLLQRDPRRHDQRVALRVAGEPAARRPDRVERQEGRHGDSDRPGQPAAAHPGAEPLVQRQHAGAARRDAGQVRVAQMAAHLKSLSERAAAAVAPPGRHSAASCTTCLDAAGLGRESDPRFDKAAARAMSYLS